MDAVHGAAGADDGVEAEDGLVGVVGGEALDEVDLGTDGDHRTGRGGFDGLLDVVGGACLIGGIHDLHGALGVDDDSDAGVSLACVRDLVNGEALMDRAEAVPEDDLRVFELGGRVAAEGFAGVPERHLLERDAHGLGGVAAEVLVRKKEDTLAALEGPAEHGRGVGGGADDAAVLAAEALQGGGAVHVGDRDDWLAAACVGGGAEHIVNFVPGGLDGVQVGHVGHRAAGGEVGEDDGLVGAGEHVGGFGHEVDAAEDDSLRPGTSTRGVSELEAVAEEVGVLHDLVALVEVAEDDDAVAEGVLGSADAEVELPGGGVAVLGGKHTLARGVRGDDVEGGGAGAVGGG